MELLVEHFGELIVGVVLLIFGAAFKNWSDTLKSSTKDIIFELKMLAKEFHQHRIETERRVTRVETLISDLHKIRVNGDRDKRDSS